MSNEKKRIESLDLLRSLAIISVVICHSTETGFQLYDSSVNFSVMGRIAGLCLYTIGRIGVPIFFFLTGFLLLDRDYSIPGGIAIL